MFVEVYPGTIEPGEKVSVRVSSVLEANSTRDIILRFFPPQGPMEQVRLHLQADSLGFASETVVYPKGVNTDSTQQLGNYTVLLQDAMTRVLLDRASFIVESAEFPYFSELPGGVFFPVIVAIATGGFTFLYNYLAGRRETKITLTQKKAESFLELRPHYAHIVRNAKGLARAIKGKQNDATNTTERDYKLCFYYLVLYIRERNVLMNKFGAYFLSDPRGEQLILAVETRIIDRLREKLTAAGYDKLGRILSNEQTLPALEEIFQDNYTAYSLYGRFKTEIEIESQGRIKEFVRDLELFGDLITYERIKMFKDWYPKKEGAKRRLNKLSNKLIQTLEEDARYKNDKDLDLDYLIDYLKKH